MKIELTDREREIILELLSRATLKGNEAETFLKIRNKFMEVRGATIVKESVDLHSVPKEVPKK